MDVLANIDNSLIFLAGLSKDFITEKHFKLIFFLITAPRQNVSLNKKKIVLTVSRDLIHYQKQIQTRKIQKGYFFIYIQNKVKSCLT